jgi:hypothetical protein
MRRLWPILLLFAGCGGEKETPDPKAVFTRFQEAWRTPESLQIEVRAVGRMLAEKKLVDADISQVSLLMQGGFVYYSVSRTKNPIPDTAFVAGPDGLVVVSGPQVAKVPLKRQVRLDVSQAAARGGMLGALTVLLGFAAEEEFPARDVQIWDLKYVGREVLVKRETIVLQYNLRIRTEGDEFVSVCRLWLSPESLKPIRRELQSKKDGRDEVVVEYYLRFEPGADIPASTFTLEKRKKE